LRGGETILFHAAAGGVGLIAAQWARAIGVSLIGTVSSDAKAELAKAHGAVREITADEGVPVVYDSIGAATFQGSLDSLSRIGTLVSFGAASGAIPAFTLQELAKRGSLSISRPSLYDHVAERATLEHMATELFELVTSGKVKITIGQRYALKDVAQAHRDLQARRTFGSSLLIP